MTSSAVQSPVEEKASFELNLHHGHKDLVQSIAFNTYGDRCATGSVDGKIRVFNRHKDGTWRLCDTWTAHGGEVLEIQWLPATIYPNLIASLGVEGWFRIWAEDPSAAPGRRFCSGRSAGGRPVFDTRSTRGAPYRSFSMKHNEETKHTYLALLATDGRLTVYENEQPESMAEYTSIDEFYICKKPARGEEVSFTVRFDPNPEPCYTALRAGVPADALGLVVAGMDTVKIYRSRDIVTVSYGVDQLQKQFYLAAEITGHRGLVRDVAWAPGNVRGYDVLATACQDGYARVFCLDTPYSDNDGKSWSAHDLLVPPPKTAPGTPATKDNDDKTTAQQTQAQAQAQTQAHPSSLSVSLAKSGAGDAVVERQWTGQPGQIAHTVREISKLDNHRTPVWRIGFDDDGQVMGSTGDDGKLLCYRQKPDGAWAKSSELAMMKTRMAAP